MPTRTKQLWAMTAAMMLVGACLIPTAAAETNTGTTATSTTTIAAAGGAASNATTPALSTGQTRVANKVAAPFGTMAGSPDNAIALATALRTGTTANLTFSSTSPTGKTTQTTTEVAVPTKPMGWGNVSHALALAQLSLRQVGIGSPTAAELQAALDGGTITNADGKTVALAGVLQQRADGMGWGQIAKTYGTTMGALNRGLKAPATTVASTTAAPTNSTATTHRPVVTGATGRGASGITTASGTGTNHTLVGRGSKGLTTATGVHTGNGASGHSAKGITTASGATAGGSSGVVSAAGNGQGNAFGRGIVTAASGGTSNSGVGSRGGASGVVTGAGTSAPGVTTAASAGGGGKANSHGNGKGGG